jgi:hypothetical protein
VSEEFFSRLVRASQSAATRLVVKSALNPMLWLSAITFSLCLVPVYFLADQPELRWAILCIGSLPVVVACFQALYFSVRAPERLQSEHYQLRREFLQQVFQKGKRQLLDETSMQAIFNPESTRRPAELPAPDQAERQEGP